MSEFSALVDAFLSWKRMNQGRSARLEVAYRLHLERLARFMGESGRTPLEAGHDDLVAFSGPWLFKQGLTDPVSRRPAISAVREFFRWAKARGHVKSNQASGLAQPKVGKKLPRVMTLADLEKLMWQPDFGTLAGVRDAAMIAVLAGCGLRAGGLVRLNESAVIPDVIEGQPRLFLQVVEKGNRARQVPVPEQAALLLRLYLEHPDLAAIDRTLQDGDKVLFVTMNRRDIPACDYRGEARRFSSKRVQQVLQRHGRRAGVNESVLHPHAMRHLFGTELAEDDVPTTTAQKLLGHADPKSTEIYQHLAKRKLTRVLDQANPLGKVNTPVSDLLKSLGKGAAKA